MDKNIINKIIQYYAAHGEIIFLESQSIDHPAAQKSYVAAWPEATFKAYGNQIEVKSSNGIQTFRANPWDALSAFRRKQKDWLFGYFGYDLKNYTETLHSDNPDEINAPDCYFMNPGLLLEIDEIAGTIKANKGQKPSDLPAARPDSSCQVNDLHSTVSKNEYCKMIEQAKAAIAEGTFYEINLSHQLQANFDGSPFELYNRMREVGSVPFASFIQIDDIAVSCLSPERFLAKRGDCISSQPIKGTMKRHAQKGKDQQLVRDLNNSEKNRAENLMIVDLVRNDLSRIAYPGSVEVSQLFEIQTFGTVHQMVSTIRAEANEADPVNIIKACYPMGSMTGAPKISAMKTIEALENYRRGIYSGAIGYFTPNGDFDFNVVIRTAIMKQKLLCYAVGGAITSDSDAKEEWEETWLKAEALLQALPKPGVSDQPEPKIK